MQFIGDVLHLVFPAQLDGFALCGGDLMAAESGIETVHEHLPTRDAPGDGVFDDALSEHLELRGGLMIARCFASDLVEFGVDEATELVGRPTCGVAGLAFLEARVLTDGVAL